MGVTTPFRIPINEEAPTRAAPARDPVQDFPTFSQENLLLIYRYASRHVRSREDAEDLTSQIFLKALGSGQLKRGAHVGQHWLYQVARATMTDYWRTCARRLSPFSLEAFQEKGWLEPVEQPQEAGSQSVCSRCCKTSQTGITTCSPAGFSSSSPSGRRRSGWG